MKGERGSQSIERGGWITNKMPLKRGLPVIVSEQVRFFIAKDREATVGSDCSTSNQRIRSFRIEV